MMMSGTEIHRRKVSVVENLHKVQRAAFAAARESGREESSVTVVAVTKTHTVDSINPLLAAGHRVFGESRVQEARAKWLALRHRYPDICLHMIGPLQINKVRMAVSLFDVIETVDRPRLAALLAQEMQCQTRWPDCLIQVNTGDEPQKTGVRLKDADTFIKTCSAEWNLPIRGLMCIPPLNEEPAFHFALLREIARRHSLQTLSMGMSHDFTIAIRLGATHVRVGTAILGDRDRR